jgi:hypothetical protein
MEYTVVSAAKMPKLIEEVNDMISQGWMPLEGGFQVQNFTDTSVRYLQAMVKVFPWSVKNMMGAIRQGASVQNPILVESPKEEPPKAISASKKSSKKSSSKKNGARSKSR